MYWIQNSKYLLTQYVSWLIKHNSTKRTVCQEAKQILDETFLWCAYLSFTCKRLLSHSLLMNWTDLSYYLSKFVWYPYCSLQLLYLFYFFLQTRWYLLFVKVDNLSILWRVIYITYIFFKSKDFWLQGTFLIQK